MLVVITYLGEGSFRIQSGDVSVLVDPPSNRLKGDVVLKTDAEIPAPDAEPGPQTEVAFPGEYESKGIEVRGIALPVGAGRAHTAYLVRWEDVKFAFLGPLAKGLEADALEKLNEPDVVFLRLGAKYLSDEAAEKVVRQLEPKVVIPAYEKSPASFLKEMGESGGAEEKFVFRKKDLVAMQGTKTIGLKSA
ncbi:MAG: MBL fold metallo-hydrolase [Candidatus Liptonbacteria bacterium]|nr:MBL fold metallo-hydrolase [Candidatus Liptonbacteria bacterium]